MKSLQRIIPECDALWYAAKWLSPSESSLLMEQLKKVVEWKQESIRMFGKSVNMPRLTGFYGAEGVRYTYSGLTNHALPWEGSLQDIARRLEALGIESFNSVLLNYYRSGNDYMGWHRDNEPELGHAPVIASLSLGSSRFFQIRPWKQAGKTYRLLLENGSLLVMKGQSQTAWEHRLPKQQGVGERLNLTFRKIKTEVR